MSCREKLFDACVIRLYDAATDLDKWPTFLESMSALFDAPLCQVVHYSPEQRMLTFRAQRGYDTLDPVLVQRYEVLSPDDPLVHQIMTHPGRPALPATYLSQAEYENTRLYREVFKPAAMSGYKKTLSTFIEPASFIGAARSDDMLPFDEQDMDFLGRLVPHFKQSLTLHHRLARLEVEHDDALAALDRLPVGVIVVDERGMIRQTNRAADDILAQGDGLARRGNAVIAATTDTTRRLLLAIQDAIAGAADDVARPGDSFMIDRGEGAAYPVVVCALWRNPKKLGINTWASPRAVLFVTDPERPQEAPADILQRLYGLTGAEAALTEQLVAGQSLDEIAAQQSVSINTVRTHLRNVFGKTGTNRQSQLVKTVLQSPIWIAARDADLAWRLKRRGA